MRWFPLRLRWYWWWLFDYSRCWPIRTLYGGTYRLDRESRRIIIDRAEAESLKREPKA